MFSKLTNRSVINVQAYKHNGTLYRQWNGVQVIEINPSVVTLISFKTKVSEKKGQKWIVREPIIWWIDFKDFHNVTAIIRKSGLHYYINIASPPIFEDNTIKFIDYDLDIKKHPEKKLRVLDRNEYDVNKKKFKYPNKLQDIVEESLENVKKQINDGEGVFDDEFAYSYVQELIANKIISPKFALDEVIK